MNRIFQQGCDGSTLQGCELATPLFSPGTLHSVTKIESLLVSAVRESVLCEIFESVGYALDEIPVTHLYN